MNDTIKTELWNQIGATLDMFENALVKCPPELWNDESQFWYKAYHTLFFTDYDLSTDPANFHPPEPYTLSELTWDELPDRVYTKEQLIEYTQHCRNKCRQLIAGLTREKAEARWINYSRNLSMSENLMHCMRHVQHHTGQLNMLLGKIDHSLPIWVSRTKVELK